MKKKSKSRQTPLDQEESELLTSFERGEWKTVKDAEEEKNRAKEAAGIYILHRVLPTSPT